jgi:hypothetical protein
VPRTTEDQRESRSEEHSQDWLCHVLLVNNNRPSPRVFFISVHSKKLKATCFYGLTEVFILKRLGCINCCKIGQFCKCSFYGSYAAGGSETRESEEGAWSSRRVRFNALNKKGGLKAALKGSHTVT